MSTCPFQPLLRLDNFDRGAPRQQLNELRDTAAVVWEENPAGDGGYWLVTRQEDIDRVLQTPSQFTSSDGPMLDDMPPEVLAEQRLSINLMDPPQHRKYRSLVDAAFRPGVMADREPMMRQLAREIIDAVIDKAQCEFVSDIALQLPMRVIYNLLGVREEDYQRVVDLTNTLTLATDPDFAENRAAGFFAGIELINVGTALAADHRKNPRDTVTMAVLNQSLDGEQLSNEEYGRFFQALVVGGIDTTRNTLAWAMLEFIRNPEQYALLQSDLSLLPNAAEEVLRLHNPVFYIRRTATEDVVLGDQQIRRGDKLAVILGGPNRDSRYFEDPDRFDITRSLDHARRNCRTFGGGPHYCIGVHQARLNLLVMLDEIARRLYNPRLLAEPRFARSTFMDGMKELSIAFDAAPSG